jgi:hypothetical protein
VSAAAGAGEAWAGPVTKRTSSIYGNHSYSYERGSSN